MKVEIWVRFNTGDFVKDCVVLVNDLGGLS